MLVFINFDNEISARLCRYRVFVRYNLNVPAHRPRANLGSSNSPYRRIFITTFCFSNRFCSLNTPDCNTRTVHPCRRCWSDYIRCTLPTEHHTRYLLREWREHPLYCNKSVSGELSATGSTVRCFDCPTLCASYMQPVSLNPKIAKHRFTCSFL
jgi:hypothetical protein